MSEAASDADRLLALDVAAGVQVGLLQFYDGNRLKASSWGGLAAAGTAMSAATEEMRGELRYGPTKSKYSSMLYRTTSAIQCGKGRVEHAEVREGLGVLLDREARMGHFMARVEIRAEQEWLRTQTALELLNFPCRALITALRSRARPRALYGAVLLVVS